MSSATAAANASMVPSTQRAIPLERRSDLVVKRIEYKGISSYVIKDPVGLKYHRLQQEQYRTLELLDGQRSLDEIKSELQRHFPALHFKLPDVQHLITDLHKKGLVYSNRSGQGIEMLKQELETKRKKRWAAIKNILYLRLPGWDPEKTLNAIYPFFRWMFQPWAVFLAMAFVVASWILIAVNFDAFYSKLPEFHQFFSWPNLAYMYLTLSVAKIIHEFGHGVSCKHFGGECHEMGVMLLVFSPCLYCDVSDSWMLRNKWRRIMIAAAGMYIEIIISAIAIFLWWYTKPGLLNHLCLNVFFVTTVTTVIFNANPLMRFDGYYMMSDFLEIPNLRPKADRMLREKFAWYCLGIESRPDPFMPETGRFWFVVYAVAAALYRWFILFGITLFLYTVLKPYGLQSIGITAAVFSLAGIVGNMIYNVYSIITAPRTEPLNYYKVTATLTALTVLIVGGLMIPIPWHIEAACLLEPENVKHVYVTIPGHLKERRVKPGQRVERGDVLAVLYNPEVEDRIHELEVEQKVVEQSIFTYRQMNDLEQYHLALEKQNTVEKKLAELYDQQRQLVLKAPINGVVVAPPRKERPGIEVTRDELTAWHGTPLDPRNQDALLEERTHVLSIAPSENLQAVLVIDQSHRDDVKVGDPVELKFDHLPSRTYTGRLETISSRHLEFAPPALSNKADGELPTVTDKQGREKLTSIAYQATVRITEDTELMRPGLKGWAQFEIGRRTAGELLWRYIRQTFHFRL